MGHKRYPPMGFADRLAEQMEASGMTQVEIAKRIGIDRKSLIGYRYGDTAPDVLTLARLCMVLHTSADYLLFGKKGCD